MLRTQQKGIPVDMTLPPFGLASVLTGTKFPWVAAQQSGHDRDGTTLTCRSTTLQPSGCLRSRDRFLRQIQTPPIAGPRFPDR
jgi:hypothetical protein